jgi:hypothetical protein
MSSLGEVNSRISAYRLARVGRLWTRSMHRGYNVLLAERRAIMKDLSNSDLAREAYRDV